jgi:L-alanine-DL-glutamate epimerase-like enolase superfamily enzyme
MQLKIVKSKKLASVQEMPRRPGTFATDLFPTQINWKEGFAFAPDTPGLGVDFDEALAETRQVSLTGWPPYLQRDDGAFTNW